MTATEIATGHLSINPQDRVIFGKPAAEAVPAEMARQGVSRAFVTSTASLARLSDGPLQAVLAGLGDDEVFTDLHRPDLVAGG